MDARDQRLSQALQQQTELMKSFAAITHKCFKKCVTRPGKSLSHTEDLCATNCVDRYSDSQVFLLQRLQEKAESEAKKAGMVSEHS
jgi:mitochondrial import inner membrane translocase subunit TIM8